MATTTIAGSTVVFSNSTAAANLSQTGLEDGSLAFTFDVLAASGGGKNTSLYSVDNGLAGDNNALVSTNAGFTGYDTDLLYKDSASASWSVGGDTSAEGAHVWIGSDGKVHYDASNLASQIQSLAAGETFTDHFNYTIKMANGTLSVGTLNVTITGQNDIPTVAAAITAAASEDDGLQTINLLAGASDVDHGAVLHVADLSLQVTDGTWSDPVSYSVNGSGVLSLDPQQFNALGASEHVTLQYSYKVMDEHGAYVNQTATVTINGANDGPYVDSAIVAPAASEDAAVQAINLLQGAHDPDRTDAVSVENGQAGVQVAVTGGTWSDPVSFSVDGSGGLSLDPSQFNALGASEQVTLQFSYNVTDGNGGSVAQTATVTINGANDGPYVDSAIVAPAASEDAVVQVINLLQGAHDPDRTDAVSVESGQAGVQVAVTAGTWSDPVSFSVDGNGLLSLDPSQFNALGATEQVTLQFSYNVTDGNGGSVAQTATVTINGANHAPLASADHWVISNNTNFHIDASWFTWNDSDPDPTDSVYVTNVVQHGGATLPAGWVATYDGSGHLTDLQITGATSNLDLDYTLSDGTLASTGSVHVQVAATGNGADNVNLSDVTYSGYDHSYISGKGGTDTLTGGSGFNELAGGAAKDTLAGGSGADHFIFGSMNDSQVTYFHGGPNAGQVNQDSHDTVQNFTSGADVFDFSQVNGVTNYAGQLAGTTVAAHSVGWITSGGETIIYANTGNSPETITAGASYSADMEVHVAGGPVLTPSDFLLHA